MQNDCLRFHQRAEQFSEVVGSMPDRLFGFDAQGVFLRIVGFLLVFLLDLMGCVRPWGAVWPKKVVFFRAMTLRFSLREWGDKCGFDCENALVWGGTG